jgi:hypothetical protein
MDSLRGQRTAVRGRPPAVTATAPWRERSRPIARLRGDAANARWRRAPAGRPVRGPRGAGAGGRAATRCWRRELAIAWRARRARPPGDHRRRPAQVFLPLSLRLGCWDEQAQCVYRSATAAQRAAGRSRTFKSLVSLARCSPGQGRERASRDAPDRSDEARAPKPVWHGASSPARRIPLRDRAPAVNDIHAARSRRASNRANYRDL